MKLRVLICPVLCAALAACGASKTRTIRANDPYGALSESEIYVQKGVQYMEAGNYEIALQDLMRATELDGRNSEAFNALAVLYQKLDQPADAERQFRKALSANSDNFGARNNYGRFLCARGQYEEAMSQFREVIGSKLYGSPWIALTNAGLCARSAGKAAEAEQYLRKALEHDSRFAPALIEMAELSLETGQQMSARAFLERYHVSAGQSPRSLWIGVETEAALGNLQGAREYARTLRERFPDTKEAAQARRYILPN